VPGSSVPRSRSTMQFFDLAKGSPIPALYPTELSHHLRQEEDGAHSDESTAWPSLTASFKFSSSSSVWTMSSGSPFAGKRNLQRRPSASYVPARRWSLRRWAQARVEGSKAKSSTLAVGYCTWPIFFRTMNIAQTRQSIPFVIPRFIGLRIQLPHRINVKQRKGSKQS
jgi:hypothetical protein